jgi:hypothetical protein
MVEIKEPNQGLQQIWTFWKDWTPNSQLLGPLCSESGVDGLHFWNPSSSWLFGVQSSNIVHIFVEVLALASTLGIKL